MRSCGGFPEGRKKRVTPRRALDSQRMSGKTPRKKNTAHRMVLRKDQGCSGGNRDVFLPPRRRIRGAVQDGGGGGLYRTKKQKRGGNERKESLAKMTCTGEGGSTRKLTPSSTGLDQTREEYKPANTGEPFWSRGGVSRTHGRTRPGDIPAASYRQVPPPVAPAAQHQPPHNPPPPQKIAPQGSKPLNVVELKGESRGGV